MHCNDATSSINLARYGMAHIVGRVDFISPIISAMVAAESLRNPRVRTLRYGASAAGYMQMNGLRDAIDGDYRRPIRGGLQGQTYSQLTQLQTADDVDFCNTIVGDL